MILNTMTDAEILRHINEDARQATPFIDRTMKKMVKYLRGFQNRDKENMVMKNWTSPKSKQKYIVIFVSDKRALNGGVFFVMVACVGYGSQRMYYAKNYADFVAITPHFIARYIERMHLPADTGEDDAIFTFMARNRYCETIYINKENKDFVQACDDGIIILTDDSDERITMRTFVSMEMLGWSQRGAVNKVLDKLSPSFSKVTRKVRNGANAEDAYIEVSDELTSLKVEAENIYKKYFERKRQ